MRCPSDELHVAAARRVSRDTASPGPRSQFCRSTRSIPRSGRERFFFWPDPRGVDAAPGPADDRRAGRDAPPNGSTPARARASRCRDSARSKSFSTAPARRALLAGDADGEFRCRYAAGNRRRTSRHRQRAGGRNGAPAGNYQRPSATRPGQSRSTDRRRGDGRSRSSPPPEASSLFATVCLLPVLGESAGVRPSAHRPALAERSVDDLPQGIVRSVRRHC